MSSQVITRARERIVELNADALLVTDAYNIFYLSGFLGKVPHAREASLLITKDKALLFVPEMYRSQASELSTVMAKEISLRVDLERDRLLQLFEHEIPAKTKVLVEGENLSYVEFKRIFESSNHKIMPCEGLVRELRQIKSAQEIDKLKRAEQITCETQVEIVRMLSNQSFTEYSELDIVDQIQRIAYEKGGEGLGFGTIVASGGGSASPHYQPTTKKLKVGEALLLDLGVVYKGYTGDLTRTIFLGRASEKFKNTYEAVLEANTKAMAECKAGITAEGLYRVSKEVLAAHSLEKFYLHGLGHGVGVEIHEEPKLREGRKDLLHEGMCLTIEPGAYFDGEFGVRIEDMVIVEKDSCQSLSSSAPKDLIEIGA